MAGGVGQRRTLRWVVGASALAATLAMAPAHTAAPDRNPTPATEFGVGPVAAPRPAVAPGAGRGMAVAGVVNPPSSPDAAPIYLALGDSITFGYDPTADHTEEADSVGYPVEVGNSLSDIVVNAGCPGETSASFFSPGADDQGCHGFRAAAPLHVRYAGTQLEFATRFLRTHPTTDLVTLGIGVNDLYRCHRISTDRCVRELGTTLETYRFNLTTILTALRAVYGGPLVLVDYYSPNYQDTVMTNAVTRLNAVMAQAARTYQAGLAHPFSVFAGPNPESPRDVCAAGLLIKLTHRCDIHPSAAGRELLAAAVGRAARSTGPEGPTIATAPYGAS